jgi:cytochrome c biogenesis protein CcdA
MALLCLSDMDMLLGYAAGALTLLNPCILPILPIVLASAFQAGRHGPLALAAGMSLAFVSLGLFVAAAGRSVGLSETAVIDASAVLMLGFGAVLLVPRLNASFAAATAGIAQGADRSLARFGSTGTAGQFAGGVLLGAVWSPCIGPTLGGAIALASQGGSLIRSGATMVAFALGVSTVIVALAYGTRSVLRQRRAAFEKVSRLAKPIMGATFSLVGLAILADIHHRIEAWALNVLPAWMLDLSVSI